MMIFLGTTNIKELKMKRVAFTMLELVFVIVVLGILAALAMPRLDRDLKQEAADHILSNIRYTQHLALTDNKHKFDKAKWQQRFWRIVFSTCSGTDRYFMVGTDDNMEDASNAFFDQNESALDPRTGKPLFWTNGQDCSNGGDGTVSEDVFISKKYGITAVTSSGSCSNTAKSMGHIGFDNLGRPHYGFSNSSQPNYASIISTKCTFTFTMSDGDTFSIDIEPETGYAFIVGQTGS